MPNKSIWTVDTMLNDASAKPEQNIKTVECRLRETLMRIAATEANIYIFTTLKSMDLATNDVTSFIVKQTSHKRVNAKPDLKVLRAAMKSKIDDATAYLKRLRQQRDKFRKKVIGNAPSKANGRRLCDTPYNHYQLVRKKEFVDAKNKIEHLRWKNLREKKIRYAPPETAEFLSHVNVFSQKQKSLKPLDPEMPFICSKNINLSSNEIKLLARGR